MCYEDLPLLTITSQGPRRVLMNARKNASDRKVATVDFIRHTQTFCCVVDNDTFTPAVCHTGSAHARLSSIMLDTMIKYADHRVPGQGGGGTERKVIGENDSLQVAVEPHR